jgi:zinc/manganese transport system substrate-binding protein
VSGRLDPFRSRLLVLGFAAALLAPALAGCSTAAVADGKIHAVAGENFYGDAISRVGGDLVSVTSILNDPNVDPHTYESSVQSAEQVADATLVVENGLGYDAFLDHLMNSSPNGGRKVIDVQQLLGLPDGSNPHVWYDPATLPKVAQAVAAELEAIQPASKPTFEANLARYLSSFAPLTSKLDEIKARYAGTPVSYTESVPGYLLAALDFKVLTPAGFARAIEDGTDPSATDVAAEQDLLTGHAVKLLIYNDQATTPVTLSTKALAGQSGVPVVGVSETMPAGANGYVGWQLAQLNAIESALGGGK